MKIEWLVALTVVGTALFATGCGQKGALYLEGHEPAVERKAREARERAADREAKKQQQPLEEKSPSGNN